MKTTVSTKGRIVIPAELRRLDDIEPGQEFEIERIDRGEYRLSRLTPSRNIGLVEWLLACPEKGFFFPIESESTDLHLGGSVGSGEHDSILQAEVSRWRDHVMINPKKKSQDKR